MTADVRELAAVVGEPHVLVDPAVRAGYELDWTGRFRGQALAVVRPATTDEVVGVVRWCADAGVAIVPQGGNTGLVAGAVPPPGTIVLSLQRLDALGAVDHAAGQVTAAAGATLGALHRHLAGSGWAFGVDLAARDTCTVGGMIATNAGGIRVLRYGSMRAQVLGVEAVLADGTVVSRLGGLVKDNTGYDLAGLLTGSEGTLGIVTAARLRLVPDPADRVVALAALDGLPTALALCGRLRSQVEGLDALEAVLSPGCRLVHDELGVPVPFPGDPPVVLLASWAGRGEPPDAFADLLAPHDAVVALDPPGQARLWAVRERQTEAIARLGVPHKLDVTLPAPTMAAFVDEVRAMAAQHGWRLHLFGHLGDGNLHVNVLGAAPDDDAVDGAVFELVAAHGGTISAEHGIGRAKARWLPLVRTAAERAAFARIKAALDPAGLLNPGVLLPPGT